LGTGTWSIVSGAGGSFSNPSSPTTTFAGVAGTTYTLRWTISNGGCTPSSDDVQVALVASPTTANAGTDQVQCATSTTLAANNPVTGSGAWTIVSGAGGSFGSPNSATSSFSGNADVVYTLRWTITNGICPASQDDVTISLTNPITTANAGADQSLCGATATLAANTPSSGTGLWTITSGSGGSVSSPANPSSNFIGIVGNTYVLRWTISKSGCTASFDEVSVTLKPLPSGNGALSQVNDLCVGESATLTVSGIINADSYEWQVPAGFSFTPSTGASITITAESGSGGTITVTPKNTCGSASPESTTVNIHPLPGIDIILPPPAFAEEVVTFSFTADQNIQSSEWALSDGAASFDAAPAHAFNAPGNYTITLTVTSTAGCVNSHEETYTVSDEPVLGDHAIKNVITANGDDKNKVLYIENLDRFPENEVKFLDRWGVEIFSKNNYQNDWEAKGKDGQFLPAGQYICIVKLNNTGRVISRTVSIIKGR
jgi:gliding motility-associated-like protein